MTTVTQGFDVDTVAFQRPSTCSGQSGVDKRLGKCGATRWWYSKAARLVAVRHTWTNNVLDADRQSLQKPLRLVPSSIGHCSWADTKVTRSNVPASNAFGTILLLQHGRMAVVRV